MRAIPERLRGAFTTRRYTNLRLPYLYLYNFCTAGLHCTSVRQLSTILVHICVSYSCLLAQVYVHVLCVFHLINQFVWHSAQFPFLLYQMSLTTHLEPIYQVIIVHCMTKSSRPLNKYLFEKYWRNVADIH